MICEKKEPSLNLPFRKYIFSAPLLKIYVLSLPSALLSKPGSPPFSPRSRLPSLSKPFPRKAGLNWPPHFAIFLFSFTHTHFSFPPLVGKQAHFFSPWGRMGENPSKRPNFLLCQHKKGRKQFFYSGPGQPANLQGTMEGTQAQGESRP